MEQAIQELAADLSNIIALYGPAVVSVISMIASIFVAIAKFKASAQDSIAEPRQKQVPDGKYIFVPDSLNSQLSTLNI